MNRSIIMVVALLWSCNIGWTQNNWTVHPPDFQYTMTITGVGRFQCQESMNEGDMVAAFINGECRGVQSFGTSFESRKYAFLTVYDTVSSGSEIQFKLYNKVKDEVLDVVYSLDFEENGNWGNLQTPYEFKTDYEIVDLLLATDTLYDFNKKGTLVTQALGMNEVGGDVFLSLEFVNDSLGPDNNFFSVRGDTLVLEQDVDFKNKKAYKIHLGGTSAGGCSVESDFTIIVINTNIPPTGLDKSDTSIKENEPLGSLVMPLIALDESPNDEHEFELVDSIGEWPDNELFSITGNQLLSQAVFDYETKEDYLLQIKITDIVGNTYIDTVLISILDVIEFEDLKAANLVTPNQDGFNDYFTIPNVFLFNNYELCIYNDNGNLVYIKSGRYNNDWDGRNDKGEELPNGSYYFVLRDQANEKNGFKGAIHLYRPNKY